MTDNLETTKTSRLSLFGFEFDRVTLAEAVSRVLEIADGVERGHYVVTPNVDHTILVHRDPALAEVFNTASLVLADGAPIVWSSRWLRAPLPERVTGSDLVPAVFAAARRPLRCFLLGARPGVAERAARVIEERFGNVRVTGIHSPELGFENDEHRNTMAVQSVAKESPDVLVLGLGTPKQEKWAYRERHRLSAKVILCAGATIDFLAGEQKRAPSWYQQHGLEWAYRAIHDPRRLLKRYATDALIFPRLLTKEWLARRQ